jgi:hypothetical protein
MFAAQHGVWQPDTQTKPNPGRGSAQLSAFLRQLAQVETTQNGAYACSTTSKSKAVLPFSFSCFSFFY